MKHHDHQLSDLDMEAEGQTHLIVFCYCMFSVGLFAADSYKQKCFTAKTARLMLFTMNKNNKLTFTSCRNKT